MCPNIIERQKNSPIERKNISIFECTILGHSSTSNLGH